MFNLKSFFLTVSPALVLYLCVGLWKLLVIEELKLS